MESRRNSTKEQECYSHSLTDENVLVTKHSILSSVAWRKYPGGYPISFFLNLLTNKPSGYKVYVSIILVPKMFSLGVSTIIWSQEIKSYFIN